MKPIIQAARMRINGDGEYEKDTLNFPTEEEQQAREYAESWQYAGELIWFARHRNIPGFLPEVVCNCYRMESFSCTESWQEVNLYA